MYSLFGCRQHPGHTDSRFRSAVRRHRRCLAADGGHFEHTMTLSLSLRTRIVTTCHFVPKILTIKEWVHFFGPLCIFLVYLNAHSIIRIAI
jgi:hypothetical protein